MKLVKIPCEQLCEVHMLLRLVTLVDAVSYCFLVKVVHNNAVPGLLVSFQWGQKVTFAMGGLPSNTG